MKLEIDKLNYSVSSKRILNEISLQIPQKKFVGLIGPNGSGKTTLLKNVYSVLSPDSGIITLNGKPINEMTSKEKAKKMAVLKQESDTEFDYNVEEIVEMGRFPHHKLLDIDTAMDKKIVELNLKKVGMWDRRHSMISELSGGEKQRIMIARALTQQTDFLVLDEPTNHLDIYYKLEILELVKTLGITVVSAIHDMELAAKYCDYLYVISKGQVVGQGTPKEVFTSEMLEKVFHVKAKVNYVGDNNDISINYISTSK